MKKTAFLLIVAVIISSDMNAQKTRFGINGGVTIANYTAKADGESETADSKIGFTLGGVADILLGDHFSIQPGLNFVQKGTKDEQTIGGITEKASLVTNHLEVPVNFLYNSNTKDAGNFFIGAGPSFAFGVSGKWKYDDGTTTVDESVNFGDTDEDDMKGFDFGANIIAGYTLDNGLTFSANYNIGISNLAPGGDSNNSLRSNYFGIKVGWLFKGNGSVKKQAD